MYGICRCNLRIHTLATSSRRYQVRAVFLAATILMFLGSCASERSTQPVPVKYAIYAAADRFGTIYIADTDSLSVVDSIPDIGNGKFLTASSDGRHVYIARNHSQFGQALLRYSTVTKSVDASIPITQLWGIGLLRDSRYLLTYVDSMEILEGSTLQSVGGISRDYNRVPTVDADSEVAVEVGDTALFRILDVFTGAIRGGYRPHLQDGTRFAIRPTWAMQYHAPSQLLVLLAELGLYHS